VKNNDKTFEGNKYLLLKNPLNMSEAEKEGFKTYLRHLITKAMMKGFNSKIQTIKANARGYRNFSNYRIAISFHCGKLELYPL